MTPTNAPFTWVFLFLLDR